MPASVRPYGTPLAASTNHANQISVASFNLLAPLYIRPIDQRTGQVQPFASFDWIAEEDSERLLGDACRLPRLLRSMQECGSDFICVQELQLERGASDVQPRANGRSRKEGSPDEEFPEFVLPKWIAPLIESSKSSDDKYCPYGIILPPQTELEKIAERNQRVLLTDAAITNAIFYRSDKWNPICSRDGRRGANTKNTTTCVTQAFSPPNGGVGNVSDSDPIVVTSIHLDACSEEKRVQQLQRCAEQSASFASTPYTPPCIIAGDYNSELFDGSCVHAFLTEGCNNLNAIQQPPTNVDEGTQSKMRTKECAASLRLPPGSLPSKEQLQSWNELYDTVRTYVHDNMLALQRIDTGCTRVAYDHDEDPSTVSDEKPRSMAQWKLDHILYTPSTLTPLGRWSTLEADEHSQNVGLPNDNIPTDHLPIAALFEMRQHPTLSEDATDALLESLNELENGQKLAVDAKQAADAQRRAELEQQHQEKNKEDDNKTEVHAKKKSKKKKGRPPPEVIEHIQNSRATMKELKAEQRIERQRFIGERTVLERMVLQHATGMSCGQWVEKQ